jgi:hypothetical protein
MDFALGLAILVVTTIVIVAICLGVVGFFMLKEKLTEEKRQSVLHKETYRHKSTQNL